MPCCGYRDEVGEADDVAPLPEDMVAEEVAEVVEDAELLGDVLAEPDELVELRLDVAPPSAFFRTLLMRPSSSFWSLSPRSVPLLVATTSRRPWAAETCISFCWLSPLRELTVAKVAATLAEMCRFEMPVPAGADEA